MNHLKQPILFFLGCAFFLSTAHADKVPSPPAKCPKHSTPSVSHAGPACKPTACKAGCKKGTTCQVVKLCIEKRKGYSSGGKLTVDHVVGFCDPKDACQTGKCESRKTCVAKAAPKKPAKNAKKTKETPSSPPAASTTKPASSSCQSTARSSLPGLTLSFLVMLVFVRIRRRSK